MHARLPGGRRDLRHGQVRLPDATSRYSRRTLHLHRSQHRRLPVVRTRFRIDGPAAGNPPQPRRGRARMNRLLLDPLPLVDGLRRVGRHRFVHGVLLFAHRRFDDRLADEVGLVSPLRFPDGTQHLGASFLLGGLPHRMRDAIPTLPEFGMPRLIENGLLYGGRMRRAWRRGLVGGRDGDCGDAPRQKAGEQTPGDNRFKCGHDSTSLPSQSSLADRSNWDIDGLATEHESEWRARNEWSTRNVKPGNLPRPWRAEGSPKPSSLPPCDRRSCNSCKGAA